MDKTFIESLHSDVEIKQCQGCHITYEESKEFTEGQVFQFLFTHGMLVKEITCRNCSNKARLCAANIINNYHKEDSLNYFLLFHRCNRQVTLNKKKAKRCNFRQALFSQTLCQHSKLTLKEMFQITSAVLNIPPPRHNFILEDIGTTSSTKVKWCLDLREVLIVAVSENSEKLGGEGHYVEIYEAVNGLISNLDEPWSWALGGVDQSTGQTFLIPVEQLDSTTLKDTILQKINPGTTIVLDCLKMREIKEFNNIFSKQNINFVVTSKCHLANEIRHRWCEVIRGNPNISYKRERVNIDHLAEYFFKSKYKNPTSRLHAFFVAAGKLYPPE